MDKTKETYSNQFYRSLTLEDFKTDRTQHVFSRIEPHTRDRNFTEALSFKVFDPMWMMTRQWQFGRFEGNDCGTPVTAKVLVQRNSLLAADLGNKGKMRYLDHKPLEPVVERLDRDITLFSRIESSLFFKKMLLRKCKRAEEVFSRLLERFPLDNPVSESAPEERTVEDLKVETNHRLLKLYGNYKNLTFDGYKFYEALLSGELAELDGYDNIEACLKRYADWFSQKYASDFAADEMMGQSGPAASSSGSGDSSKGIFEQMPGGRLLSADSDEGPVNAWNDNKLGYEFSVYTKDMQFEAEDYHSGKLSWYSFDCIGRTCGCTEAYNQKLLSYLPTPAVYPGSPKRNLWEFEDGKVAFGDLEGEGFSFLANAVIMQYVSMYGNDWLHIPFEVENGTFNEVLGILLKDTFGEYVFIDHDPQDNDAQAGDVGFMDRWAMFQNSLIGAYKSKRFLGGKGMLAVPSLPRREEGKPVEEIHFLRDEMANMVWAVEETVNDGCGGSRSGKSMSEAINDILKEQVHEEVGQDEGIEYSYLFQNRVPIHWIPFIPRKIRGLDRDIIFQRGRMPVFYNGKYDSIRPSSSLLRVRHFCNTVIPFLVNEEELSGSGIQLSITPQRTRWYNGESFLWYGARKRIGGLQLNSGLMNDQLIDVETHKNIVTGKK